MFTRTRPDLPLAFRLLPLVVLPGLFLPGCGDGEPPPEIQEELARLQAEGDSLESELRRAEGEVEELRSGLQAVELPEDFVAGLDEPPRTARDTIRALALRAEQLAEARQDAESRAWVYRQRVDSLETERADAADTYEERIAEAEDRVAELEDQIAARTAELDELEAERERLDEAVQELEGTLGAAHYVVGTREELLERGVVQREGGSRFLGFLWRRGQIVVPVRNPDPADFTTIDLREDREIPLPRGDVVYRIITRQNPEHLGPDVAPDGTFTGDHLQILDPEGFRAASSFLVILEEEG